MIRIKQEEPSDTAPPALFILNIKENIKYSSLNPLSVKSIFDYGNTSPSFIAREGKDGR